MMSFMSARFLVRAGLLAFGGLLLGGPVAAQQPSERDGKASFVQLDGSAVPNGVVAGDGVDPLVWFAAAQRSAVGEIDPASRSVAYISLGHGAKPRALARCANGNLYALDPALNVIHEVTPQTEEVRRHPMPGGQNVDLSSAACTASNQLVFTGYNGFVGRLDTATGQVTLIDAAGGRGAAPVAVTAAGVVWFASYVSNTVVRLDVAAMRQDAFRMPVGVEGPKGIAIDGMGRVWVTAFRSARVARFDPRRKDWSAWAVGDGSKPYGLAADGQGSMLVTDTGRNQLLRVDAATGSIMKVADLSERGQARGVARLGANLWIAEQAADRIAVVDVSAPPSQ